MWFNPIIKSMLLLTVLRTLFYQFMLLFIGLCIGFIINPEWVGMKSILVNKSVNNIFFPLDYENDPQLKQFIKSWGAYKVYANIKYPAGFEIVDENIYYNDEWYWCRYKYLDENGLVKFDEATTRVKWKTWEYYYDYEILDTPEKIRQSIERNKFEIENRNKEIEKSKNKEKEIIEQSKTKQDVTT